MTVLATRTPVARKAHWCEWCWGPIVPGIRYVRIAAVSDGRAFTWKACEPCNDLAVTCWDLLYNDGDGISDDDMFEWAKDLDPADDSDEAEAGRAYLERRRAADAARAARAAAERGEGLW